MYAFVSHFVLELNRILVNRLLNRRLKPSHPVRLLCNTTFAKTPPLGDMVGVLGLGNGSRALRRLGIGKTNLLRHNYAAVLRMLHTNFATLPKFPVPGTIYYVSTHAHLIVQS